jgi:homoserine kinase
MVKVGAGNIHLAGSGPTLFTLIKDETQAEELCIRLKQQGLKSHITDTLTTVDRVE